MKFATTVSTTIDFDRDGKQIGFFNLPLSVHEDAWGVVPVPMTVIKNGRGPTVILEGGNHGDEYEGPIALSRLASTLKVALAVELSVAATKEHVALFTRSSACV